MVATFLDRDGVINRETHLVNDIAGFTMHENAGEAIRLLNEIGPVIVITNQPQVARGLVTEEGLAELHRHMIKQLAAKGAKLDAIYYCPHHPEQHHEDVPEWAQKYRIECSCRKPKPGMLLQVAKDLSIDLKTSFMVGDSTGDMLAGKTAGCTTILIKTGNAGLDGKYDTKPDYVCENILDAARLIRAMADKTEGR